MNTTTSRLGRLEQVDLRHVWTHEAGDFTPWLAQADNIALLGDAIGLDLEVESEEVAVGPFRADILCRDTASDAWVLVENQLERTDHAHLGQLMTYAAGLEAATIVWIADRFTDEHRAALDWLNDITSEGFNFFGLEVELWRIGDSSTAPKFNIVCKPNGWKRSVASATHHRELSELQQGQLEFWTGLCLLMEQQGGSVRPVSPRALDGLNFSMGRTGFYLFAHVLFRQGEMDVSLKLHGNHAKEDFHALNKEREQIDAMFGERLIWDEWPRARKTSYIYVKCQGVPLDDRAAWPEQHAWIRENLEALYSVFAERVKRLRVESF